MVQEFHALRSIAALFAVAVLLGGCSLASRRPNLPEPSSSPETPGSPGSSITEPLSLETLTPDAPTEPHPPPRENRLSAATRSLVTQARTLMSHGDLDGASSTLDRALRIEPNNPLLWIELGRLRLAEGDAHQAEGCGRKALSAASGDVGTTAESRRLLADALRAQRRNQEASESERQPLTH